MIFCLKFGDRVIRVRRITKFKNVKLEKGTGQKKITTRVGTSFCINGCNEYWKDNLGRTRKSFKQKGNEKEVHKETNSYKRPQFRTSRQPLREKRGRKFGF